MNLETPYPTSLVSFLSVPTVGSQFSSPTVRNGVQSTSVDPSVIPGRDLPYLVLETPTLGL